MIANFLSFPSPTTVGEIQFTDNTGSNTPITTWLWDFGDTVGTSTVKEPTYIYSLPGVYRVKLDVSDGTNSATVEKLVLVSLLENNGTQTIIEMVGSKIPQDYIPEQIIQNEILKWFGLIDLGIKSPKSRYKEENYPFNVRCLIADLIVYDNIQKAIGIAITTNLTLQNSTPVATDNTVKTIEMGPAKTEWHNNLADKADMMSHFMKSVVGNNSLLDAYRDNICNVAGSIGIKLYYCKPCKKVTLFRT